MSINHKIKILIIDDNPEIHKDFKKVLSYSSYQQNEMLDEEKVLFGGSHQNIHIPKYEIASAFQGDQGVAMVKRAIQKQDPFALAFVDVRMPPGYDGVETIAKIWKLDSDIQTVICTAYSDYSWEDIFHKFGDTDRLLILKKPFDNLEARQCASTLIKKWLLAKEVNKQLATLETTVTKKTKELTHSLSLLRATFNATADGILVTNNKKEIVDYNKKFAQIWKISKEALESQNFNFILNHFFSCLKYPFVLANAIEKLYQQPKSESFDTLILKNKKILECFSHPQLINSKIVGRVWSFRDITKRHQLEEQLSYQATHDVLTGLANRALLMEELNKALKQANKEKKYCALLFFDLDHFKLINDSLGHAIGDKLLVVVANRISACIRHNDILARIGGDEFAAVIRSANNEEDVKTIIHRFFSALTKPIRIEGHTFNVTMSVGISLYPKDGDNADLLFKNADVAMYRAKEIGQNHFQFYTASMNLDTTGRLELSNHLQNAIQFHELELFYQPVINLKKNKIVGFEALIRWFHPSRGLLMPVKFIPIAEETGLIVPIGEWILRTACQQVKKWHDQGFPNVSMAVNISPKQFKYGNIPELVSKVLIETGIPPRYLCLEITENLLLEDAPDIHRSLTQLKEIGITIAIDDFGVGYSNLNYITKFPFDKLKIDKSFIRNVTTNINDTGVVLAILGIAKTLKMEVLAEGVETYEQVAFLQQHNCQELQGFLVSKPLSAKTCEEILKSPETYLAKLYTGRKHN